MRLTFCGNSDSEIALVLLLDVQGQLGGRREVVLRDWGQEVRGNGPTFGAGYRDSTLKYFIAIAKNSRSRIFAACRQFVCLVVITVFHFHFFLWAAYGVLADPLQATRKGVTYFFLAPYKNVRSSHSFQ